MTCIKTGALVYFDNYSYCVRGDLYAIGDVNVLRWNPRSIRRELPAEDYFVVGLWEGDEVWHREDLGVSVIPNDYIWKAN